MRRALISAVNIRNKMVAVHDFDEEIALDGVPAFLEVKLSLSGNRLDELIRQKDLLAPKLKQSSR